MTSLKMVSSSVEFTTCKVVFPHGIDRSGVEKLLNRYTKTFDIANFYEDRQVGCNRIAFAVVDLPLAAMQQMLNDPAVREIDTMQTYSKKPSGAEECGGGGGCCTPKG